MMISSEEFRDALCSGEHIHGLTVSAFASVSPDPPLVAIIIDHRHRAYALLEREGAVSAVNILHQSQIHLSDRLAWVEDKDRILERSWTTTVTGAPGLADPLVWLDCTILGRHRAGTHTIYVGEVQASRVPWPDEPPLVYWNRGYRQLELPEYE